MRVRAFCLVVGLLISLPAFAADTSPPTKPSVSDDGTYTGTSGSLRATWTSSDPESGIAEYQYLIRRDSSSGSIVVNWASSGPATEVTRTGLSLANGKTYFIGVRAKNGAGLWSSTGYSNGIKVDTTAPSPVTVTDDGTITSSNTTLHATWTGSSDSGSGLLDYQYLIRQDTNSGAIIRDWTSVGLAREVTLTGLSLVNGKNYFVGVRAKNGAGIYSSTAYSNGIIVQADETPPPSYPSYQGFGAGTLGGEGQALYRVTNLNDSGPGSLREAVAQGNRYIVFDVGGQIVLTDHIYVRGAFITVDGLTAPTPGITLNNHGLHIQGSQGAHDIIVTGIRVRNSNGDGMQVRKGGYNVVIDRVSIQGSADGNLDITEDSRDVTVSWSILAEPAGSGKTMLIKYNPAAVSLHHNLFVKGIQRNPHVRIDDSDTAATEPTLDMRNNVVWDWGGGYGTQIWHGAWANIVANFYANPGASANDKAQAIIICNGECDGGNLSSPARAYLNGNYSADGVNLGIQELVETMPFAAPPVDTTDPLTACAQVLANAGVRPLDFIDQQYLSLVSCLSNW